MPEVQKKFLQQGFINHKGQSFADPSAFYVDMYFQMNF